MKRIIAIIIASSAILSNAATITSTGGVAVEADVVSFEDGLFTVRKGGQLLDIPAAGILRIEFEPAETYGAETLPNDKIDIRKMVALVSRQGEDDVKYYFVKPKLRVDCRSAMREYKQRPFFVLRLNVKEPETGSLKEVVCWYDWKNNSGWKDSRKYPCDPSEASAGEPQCDWGELSPASLESVADRDPKYPSSKKNLRFEMKPDIVALRAEVWLGGSMIASIAEQKDMDFPLPRSWQ